MAFEGKGLKLIWILKGHSSSCRLCLLVNSGGMATASLACGESVARWWISNDYCCEPISMRRSTTLFLIKFLLFLVLGSISEIVITCLQGVSLRTNVPSSFFLLHCFASDGLMYWREKQESHKPNDNPWLRPYYRPRSADIEITAYALLAYSLERDLTVALAISRWLSQQRNSLGGYSSTQV